MAFTVAAVTTIPKTVHDPGCRRLGGHSSEARHAADAVNLHRSALGFAAVGKWVAVRLRDGKSDGVLYDDKQAAVRHQLDEHLCMYVRLSPAGVTPCAAESLLKTHRKLYAAGFRLADPDATTGGPQVIPRLTDEDQAAVMGRLR